MADHTAATYELTDAFGTYETFTVARSGAVIEVTLSRPDLLNRCDTKMHSELPALFRTLAQSKDARSIVLASTGKVFSAGGDFDMMLKNHHDLISRFETHEEGKRLVKSILECQLPIIVALHADAIGVGATIVLNCDAVVASKNAKISDPHVNIGQVAGDGGCVAWPASAGLMRARRHLLTGDPVTADLAFQLGMITDLVETPEETLPMAREIASKIAGLPPLAVQGTKRSLSRLAMHRVMEVLDYSFSQQAITSASEDLMEAIAAFREKRRPEYHGR